MTESTGVFPFVKSKGQTITALTTKDSSYLQGAAGTDIPQCYPGFALQIQVALMGGAAAKSIPDAHDVELDSARLTDLSAVNSEVAP